MGSGDEAGAVKWFAIETTTEFCMVKDSDVLCEENVAIGDQVEFFWTKKKKLEGKVRFIDSK